MMALQTTTDLSIDFYDKKYILINAKQLDKKSRYLSITCYNQGEIFHIYSNEHSAYVRYRKPDGYAVFNSCEISSKGKIIVELTEQMLASDGICDVDLMIVNKGGATVNPETGEIIAIDNASILSSMVFHIDVHETSVEHSDIESSYEYDGLNIALEKAEAEYTEVMKTSKSWAVGGTGIRVGEDTDNAKFYAGQASASANEANISATNAADSEELAEDHMQDALSHKNDAYTYMTNANTYMENALTSEQNAKTSEINAKASETNASISEANAKTSEQNAKASETSISVSEQNAKASEANAFNSANKAQSYAVGNTGTRNGEDADNAKYYYEMVKVVANGLNSGFIPIGTISFSELATAEKATGYTYNISDDFVTDDSFVEGYGKSYTAGTNVYFTASGRWDCFGGTASPTATIDEVREYLNNR